MTLRIDFLLLTIMLVVVFSLAGCAGSGGAASAPASSSDNVVIKFANLNAAQVVPAATATTITASGILALDTTTGSVSGSLSFEPQAPIITAEGPTVSGSTITAIEVGEGAPGTNGNILMTLTAPTRGIVWKVSAGTLLTPTQVSSFVAGNLYFIVRSVSHPDGEIRGQLIAPTPADSIGYGAGLVGTQEVPPVITNVFGICDLSLNIATGIIRGGLQLQPIPATEITSVNLHEGGRGENGNVVVALAGSGHVWSVPTGTVLNPAQIVSFGLGNFNVNVHTVAHPDGEIRGQLDDGPTISLAKTVIKAGNSGE